MLGQATAVLERAPRRWIQQWWGYPYIHKRQDWHVLWPWLGRLPERGLRVLDAGCGVGRWTLELAMRRPGWQLVGMDRSAADLAVAERARRRLGVSNVAFVCADLAEFRTRPVFDVVLSCCSAHYLALAGKGVAPFRCFAACLAPGGELLFYGPRSDTEAPFVRWLPRPGWHPVFVRDQLLDFCRECRLDVLRLTGRIGRLGTMAKQLDCLASGPWRRLWLGAGLYAAEVLLAEADAHGTEADGRASLMWLLVARARPVAAHEEDGAESRPTFPPPAAHPR